METSAELPHRGGIRPGRRCFQLGRHEVIDREPTRCSVNKAPAIASR